MSTWRLWRLFHGVGGPRRGGTSVLSIIAFAADGAIFLTVLGGVHGFARRASPDGTLRCLIDSSRCGRRIVAVDSYAGIYVILSVIACLLLTVPFAALAGSAARLAASRRDARLAALRLVGATTGQVVRLTAMEAAGQALVGVLLGIVGYVALMPVVGLVPFQRRHFGMGELWVGGGVLAAVCVAVMALALVSSLVALRRVSITPLGVAQRSAQPLPTAWRLVVFVVVVAASVALMRSRAVMAHLALAQQIMVVVGVILVCFALVNLVGTWAIASRARHRARRPRNAATMIAMRRILDNPRRAWRNVSGIALSVFVAGITSVAGYMARAVDTGRTDDPAVTLLGDIGTGGLLTLAFAAVLAAVSCGVMQAGSVYEQQDEYRMLALEGMDMATMGKARFIEVMTPLNVVVVIAAGCSMLLMLPLMAAVMMNPTTLLYAAGGIALCYALVSVGVVAANRVAKGLDLVDRRGDD